MSCTSEFLQKSEYNKLPVGAGLTKLFLREIFNDPSLNLDVLILGCFVNEGDNLDTALSLASLVNKDIFGDNANGKN